LRTNLEDRWYKDQRRDDLILELAPTLIDKSLMSALVDGVAIRAWGLAQTYWIDDAAPRSLIPWAVWADKRMPEALIRVGLAVLCEVPQLDEHELQPTDHRLTPAEQVFGDRTGKFIYLRGTREQYSKFLETRAARKEAGERSAEVRRARNGTATPPNARNQPKPNADHPPNTCSVATEEPPNATEPSSSNSPSSSSSGEEPSFASDEAQEGQLALPTGGALKRQTKAPNHTWLAWDAYRAGFARRWGAEPQQSKAQMGLMKRFVEKLPDVPEEAIQVAGAYPTHTGARYVSAMHPLEMLVQDAIKLHVEWKTRTQVNTHAARQAERAGAGLSQAQRLMEKAREIEAQEARG
jgi:hypothetical protein